MGGYPVFKFAVAGISHETNTYCKEPTQITDFKIMRGQEILDTFRGVRFYIGGMIDAARELEATLVPVYFAQATPSGTIARGAYDSMAAELLDGIKQAMPLDGVALALHGAGVVEGLPDLEGHLCSAVRQIVGPNAKIVVTLDLHGNISQMMADAIDMCFGVHFYPHTDSYERGHEAVHAIARLLAGTFVPVIHVERIPAIITAATTNMYPANAVNELCWEMEKRPGILDCTFFHGFARSDIPNQGAQVIVTAQQDPELAKATAKEVARWVWAHRADFLPDLRTAEEAIAEALAVEGGPVVINEPSDNAGGGAPSDGTHLLRAMIEAKLENACFGFIHDPAVVEQVHAAGVGTTVRVSLGGKYDNLHGEPLDIDVYVKCLTDGRYVNQGPMSKGLKVDLGKMARLQIGGIDILVSTVRTQTLGPEAFYLHGIDVNQYKIVGLKSIQHFRAAFQPIAKAIITADTPGLTTRNVTYYPRTHTPRPIWPLDEEACYKG